MLPEAMQPLYRDEELIVLTMINQYFGWVEGAHSGDQTPNDSVLESVLPFVRVGRVGGAPIQGSEHTDRPVVDVDVFARTRRESKQMAKEIEQLLMARRHPIDRCNVLMGPQRIPWVEGQPIVRFYASYHLSLRR